MRDNDGPLMSFHDVNQETVLTPAEATPSTAPSGDSTPSPLQQQQLFPNQSDNTSDGVTQYLCFAKVAKVEKHYLIVWTIQGSGQKTRSTRNSRRLA
jgi:hypothetical protein